MKLNIGSSAAVGKYKQREWINFDIVKQDRVNVIGDMLQLPFKDSSIDEIHCVHVLEHLTREKHLPALKEMHRVLKPGSSAYVEVPDFRAIVAKLHDAFLHSNIRAIHIWTTSVYGKTERKGMAHHFGFHWEKLKFLFEEAGFKDIELPKEMISRHYKLEPVLLVRGEK